MTDDLIKSTIGVEETMQMLQFREVIKSQMTPEEYALNMEKHKASIQEVINMTIPKCTPVKAAEWIVDRLDADWELDEDQREMWKAIIVVAAFEMQEF